MPSSQPETVNPIQGNNGGFGANLSLILSFSFSLILSYSCLTYSPSRDFFSSLDAVFCVHFALSMILLLLLLARVSSCHRTTTAGASFYRVVNRGRRIIFYSSYSLSLFFLSRSIVGDRKKKAISEEPPLLFIS